MKTLKEICYNYNTDDTEQSLKACVEFLSQEEIYDNAVNIISEILKAKIRRCEDYIGKSHNLAYATDFYYKQYKDNVASEFDTLTRKFILEIPFSDYELKWLQENIPNIKKPKNMWRPLYEYITEDLKLTFKED